MIFSKPRNISGANDDVEDDGKGLGTTAVTASVPSTVKSDKPLSPVDEAAGGQHHGVSPSSGGGGVGDQEGEGGGSKRTDEDEAPPVMSPKR